MHKVETKHTRIKTYWRGELDSWEPEDKIRPWIGNIEPSSPIKWIKSVKDFSVTSQLATQIW